LTTAVDVFNKLAQVSIGTNLEIHETVKPDVAIIEMTMTGTVTATGAPYEQSYVSVLTVRDGLIARYRDYWNPLRVAE
jgi:ketosteroid isomerase-like protein